MHIRCNNICEQFIRFAVFQLIIINTRAEDYAKNHLNEYDLCVSRAVAFIDIITSLSFPLIKKDGKVILMKGSLSLEKDILDKHLNELNVSTYRIENFKLPNTNDERNLVVIEKKEETTKVLEYSQIIKRNKKWNV